jgi:DnaK suppressor protein
VAVDLQKGVTKLRREASYIGNEGVVIIMTDRKQKMNPERYSELRRILEERRREMVSEVQGKIRDVRTEGAETQVNGVVDAAETSDADIQDDIEFALIQMKAETLSKIDEALARLEEGSYGYCFECGEEISERRLRALPFAVRCKDCEEAREQAELRERQLAQRRGSSFLFDISS